MLLAGTLPLLQLLATQQASPVLAFPQPGIDDPKAYQGYQTRFYRDAAGNTVQIYLDGRSGRVVHLLANAENESVGFTLRDRNGQPVTARWDGQDARVAASGSMRFLEYQLAVDASHVYLGWFLLGSMRVERDLQYAGKHRAPFNEAPFIPVELKRLLTALGRFDEAEQRRHLALLNASSLSALRSRLQPAITTRGNDSMWVLRVVQRSLDRRDSLSLEIHTDRRRVLGTRMGDSISLRARAGESVYFSVRIGTTGRALTPLARREIFNPEFLTFLAGVTPRDSADVRARWLERQVRGVELLSSHEKLMAGLPAYATYFGRDMLVSALMMRPIWRTEMSEFVIASVLRKLSSSGQVSHEEALGGQATREAAAEYATLTNAYFNAAREGNRTAAEGFLARARAVLRDHGRVRENYNMIDDEFQFPVVVARWLGDSTVSAEHKRQFLLDASETGMPRVVRLLQELALVARMTAPYAADPIATNLVSFARRDGGGTGGTWASASWRDSGAGYGGGRFAMDVNAIWAPHALASISLIFRSLEQIGLSVDSLARVVPELRRDTPLGGYATDTARARAWRAVWSEAWRHFIIALSPSQLRAHVDARLAALSDQERRYWTRLLAESRADRDSLTFLALSLDGDGRPLGIANTDPATRLFLSSEAPIREMTEESVLRDVRLFARPFPVGLFIDRVGPVVANDAYAPPAIWPVFEADRYHGPRVVWGREVNLFLLGVTGELRRSNDAEYTRELSAALDRVMNAVKSSGFRSELWSYEFIDGRPQPVRYGSGSDVQLWSTTDLAVQFALSRIGRFKP